MEPFNFIVRFQSSFLGKGSQQRIVQRLLFLWGICLTPRWTGSGKLLSKCNELSNPLHQLNSIKLLLSRGSLEKWGIFQIHYLIMADQRFHWSEVSLSSPITWTVMQFISIILVHHYQPKILRYIDKELSFNTMLSDDTEIYVQQLH